MSIRLNKVSQEFNVSFSTIATLLKEYCRLKVSSINETISDEQYEILKTRLSKDEVYDNALKKFREKRGKVKLRGEEKEVSLQFKKEFERDVNKILKSKKTIQIRIRKSASDYKADKNKSKNSKKNKMNSYWSKITNHKGFLRIVSIPFGGKTK